MSNWSDEVWRLVLVCLTALFIGWLMDAPTLILLLSLFAFVCFHLYHLYQLEKWLRSGNATHPMDLWGVWGNIYFYVYRLQKRFMARRKRLAAIVKQFKQSTAAMPDGAVVLTSSGQIAGFNQSATELLGLKSPQDVGQRLVNLVRSPHFFDYLTGEDYAQPIVMESPSKGGKVLSLTICPYGDQQRLLLVRDITNVQKLETVRRDFISNISHELRTPLTVLKGCVEAMECGDDVPQQWRRSLALVAGQTERMEQLVNDLLLLSRLESAPRPGAYLSMDMPNLIHSVVGELQHSKSEKHRFKCDVDANLWLMGSDTEIRSVVSNLIANAINYSPNGGLITVRWRQAGDGLYFEVADEGVGILPEFIPRITERFFRIDVVRSRTSGGTGLGLAIVKHVLDLYKGRLTIKSRIGKGSLFRCRFPLRLGEVVADLT